MRAISLTTAAVTVLAAFVAALPAPSNHVVHEKRSGSSSWSPHERLQPDRRITLPVRIGLTEKNLHLGDDMLMKVSDPASEDFGKHWTHEQV